MNTVCEDSKTFTCTLTNYHYKIYLCKKDLYNLCKENFLSLLIFKLLVDRKFNDKTLFVAAPLYTDKQIMKFYKAFKKRF